MLGELRYMYSYPMKYEITLGHQLRQMITKEQNMNRILFVMT